jgi:glycosyltransferase involved in cell wall biosynthesis
MISEVPQVFGSGPSTSQTGAGPESLRMSSAPGERPLRVLMIVESAAGGTGRHVLDLAEGMANRGHHVHVIYSTGRIDRFFQARLAALRGVRHLPLAMRTSIHPSDASVVCAVRRYARSHGPFDVVHGHSSKAGAIARLAALGTSARAVYTLHGLIMMDPGLAPWKRAFYLAIERALGLRTQRIIAVSPEEGRAAVRVGLGESRVVVVPNGVSDDPLVPRARARCELGLPDNAIVVGFIGRLVEQKAPEMLLRAFARAVNGDPSLRLASPRLASPRLPSLRLAMVGSGPLMQPLCELAVALKIAHRVLWLGERDARTVITAFDVFAISSRKEGFPYVVLEAMAAGLPVVATSSSGVELLVQPGVNGVVVPADDTEMFSDALTALVTDPEWRASCGLASRRIVSRFTIDAMVEATLRAYGSRPARGPRRQPANGRAERTLQTAGQLS